MTAQNAKIKKKNLQENLTQCGKQTLIQIVTTIRSNFQEKYEKSTMRKIKKKKKGAIKSEQEKWKWKNQQRKQQVS